MRWPWQRRRTPRVVISVPSEIGPDTMVWLTLRGTLKTDGGSTFVLAEEVTAHAMTGAMWSEQFTDWGKPVLEVRGLVVKGGKPESADG